MAKQIGPNFKVMCKQNLQFYYMDGKYYVRKKSSLTGKRVKKDKKFRLTMVYAGIMAQASKIASSVYRQIRKEEKKHSYFRTLTGMAQKLIRKGVSAEEVYEQLYNKTFPPVEPVITESEKESAIHIAFANEVLKKIFSVDAVVINEVLAIVLDSQSP